MSNQLYSIEDLLLALAKGDDPRELAEKSGLNLGTLRKRISRAVESLERQVREEIKRIPTDQHHDRSDPQSTNPADQSPQSKPPDPADAPKLRKGKNTGISIYKHLQDVGRMVRWGVKSEALYRHLNALALDPETKAETRTRIGLALLSADAVNRRQPAPPPPKSAAYIIDGTTRIDEMEDPVQQRIAAGLELLAEKERRENAG